LGNPFLAPLDAVSLAPDTEHDQAARRTTRAPLTAMFKRNLRLSLVDANQAST